MKEKVPLLCKKEKVLLEEMLKRNRQKMKGRVLEEGKKLNFGIFLIFKNKINSK